MLFLRRGSEVSQLRYVLRGGRGLQQSEIGEHVRGVLVADPLLFVGRHVEARRAHLRQKRLPGKAARNRGLGAAPAALPVRAVAGVAGEIDEELFAALGRAQWRLVLREGGSAEQNGGEKSRNAHRRSPQRSWHTTSTRAGAPLFTTFSARWSAGPTLSGSLIGPSPCTPKACASLPKSTSGS